MGKEDLEACKRELTELEESLTEENLAELTEEEIERIVNQVAKLKVELEMAEALQAE